MSPGDIISDRYELVAQLGRGATGVVWEARHRGFGRRVALKILRPEVRDHLVTAERFLREARAAAAVASSHIVDILDVGECDDGTPFLAMEYLEGESLDGLIEREGALEIGRAVTLALQLCRAMAKAHARGVIHRDLKPANLFVTRDEDGAEWLKVLDFGVAKVSADLNEYDLSLTDTGAVVGTPLYMAPEQMRGARDTDERADVYSIGVVLYRMLTGELPYQASSYAELVDLISSSTPTAPSCRRGALPAGLDQAVLRAVAAERSKRYDDVASLFEALRPYSAVDLSLSPVRLVARDLGLEARADSGAPSSAPGDSLQGGAALTSADDGQRLQASKRERSWRLKGAAAAVVALTIVAVALLMTGAGDGAGRSSEGRQPAQIATEGPQEASPRAAPTEAEGDEGAAETGAVVAAESVSLFVEAHPSRARIAVDGVTVEGNPHLGSYPRDDRQHRVTASYPGFDVVHRDVAFDDDQRVLLTLESARPHPLRPSPAPVTEERGSSTQGAASKAGGEGELIIYRDDPYGGR